MEIQQLRHLIAAVQYGNLLKAADESHISQSGLSRSIKSLETRLGVPLLIRKSKGVEPTVFGLSLLRRAHVIIHEAAQSIRDIHAIEQARVGEVCVGVTPHYAHHCIPDTLAELTRQRPAIRVTIVVASILVLVDKLKVGDIDLGFGLLGSVEPTADLIVDDLTESRSRVFAGSGHPLLRKPRIDIEDLVNARWAMLNGESLQRNFVNFFHVRGQNIPAQAVRTDSVALLKRIVQGSDLLTVLPVDAAADELKSGRLKSLPVETPAEFSRVGFVFRKDALTTPQMRLLIEAIRVKLSSSPVRRRADVTQPTLHAV